MTQYTDELFPLYMHGYFKMHYAAMKKQLKKIQILQDPYIPGED